MAEFLVEHAVQNDGEPDILQFERCLGDTEASYYLPSRADGANDMYLHLGCRAPAHIMHRSRVALVWAIMRIRHPLFASKVKMHDYSDIRFVYQPPNSPKAAIEHANESLEYRFQGHHELIDSYLNGPRTLSDDRLSHLIVSQSDTTHIPSTPVLDLSAEPHNAVHKYEILFFSPHFVGDGMALHQCANDFFYLLDCSKSNDDLKNLLTDEWSSQLSAAKNRKSVLPRSLEERLSYCPSSNFCRLAGRVDFEKSQERLIGGHSFPRTTGRPRRTQVSTISFDPLKSKAILKKCKQNGVSIASGLFAICNIAWAKTCSRKLDMPIMIYSAVNLRPNLNLSANNDSYLYTAIGFFNVVLPAFLPREADLTKMFWHRARLAQEQSSYAARNPMLVSRTREMARERAEQARRWAKEDDEKERGVWRPPPRVEKNPSRKEKPPSIALMGLSLMGDLDGIYKHATYPNIVLHMLRGGSRQRAGGMLLTSYTFAGRIWLNLAYDENGYEKDAVERFWGRALGGIEEMLSSGGASVSARL